MSRCVLISGSYGLGAGIREPARGPKALREAGLLNRLSALRGVSSITDSGDYPEPSTPIEGGDKKLRYLDALIDFSARFGAGVEQIWHSGDFSLVLGGDHSISISSISAALNGLRARLGSEAKLGVLWVDAHGDLNTRDTTPSGNIHGMSLAALLGYGDPRLTGIGGSGAKLRASDVALIGVRDLDQGERELIKRDKIACFTMKEIDMRGIGSVCEDAIMTISRNTDAFIVSFDFDACDPSLAPAVGSSVRGGLTWREAHLIMELAAEQPKFRGLELIEYAPERDIDGITAELGLALAESALGKTIL